MEMNFGNRYEVRRSVRELPLGTLFEAYDRPLNRSVLLYEIAPERTTTDSRAAVMRGAAFTHDRFLHILDVGTEKGMPYAVFKSCEGGPLIDELHRHRIRPQQLLTAVYELGKAMQDAAEEGIYGYSVCADNLWLGSGASFLPIHYWDAADERRRGAFGLCHLLYQLSARTDQLPENAETAENRLRISLRSLPSETMEAVLSLYRRVHREKLSLTAFLLELHNIRQTMPSSEVPEPVAIRPPQSPAPRPELVQKAPEQKSERPAPAPKEAVSMEETKRFQAVAEPAGDEAAETEEADSSSYRGGIWKKIALIAGAASLFTVVFIGGIMLIFHWANPTEPARSAAKTVAQSPATASDAASASKEAVAATAKEDQPPVTTADAAPTAIPQLVGISKAEAEKRALAAGLHYNFYIEKDTAAKDTVFKQDPQAGAPAVKGDSVTFWVSKGN